MSAAANVCYLENVVVVIRLLLHGHATHGIHVHREEQVGTEDLSIAKVFQEAGRGLVT